MSEKKEGSFAQKFRTVINTEWKLILCILLLIALYHPLVENIAYPYLTSYDTWNFLSLSTQVVQSHGIPMWEYFDHYPDGRPFLYPPALPSLLAFLTIVTGVPLLVLIKFSTLLLYPAYILGGAALAYLFAKGSERVGEIVLLATILLMSVVQAFINSLNSLSQFTEILFIYALIYALHEKKYLFVPLIIGALFFTHFFTPFLATAGVVLFALFFAEKSEKKKILAGAAGGVLIGAVWFSRYFLFPGYIHLNSFMPEHFILNAFFVWRFFVEGSSFILIALLLVVLFFYASKKSKEALLHHRLTLLLISFIIAFIPAITYPERVITYLAPFFSVLCAVLLITADSEVLKKASIFLMVPFVIILLFYFSGTQAFVNEYSFISVLVFVLAILAFGIFSISKLGLGRVAFFALFILSIYTYAGSELAFPFVSWANPETTSLFEKASPYSIQAAEWLVDKNEHTVIATDSHNIAGYLVYLGAQTPTYVVIEFSRTGEALPSKNAQYFIATYPDTPNNPAYIDFFGDGKYEIVYEKKGSIVYKRT